MVSNAEVPAESTSYRVQNDISALEMSYSFISAIHQDILYWRYVGGNFIFLNEEYRWTIVDRNWSGIKFSCYSNN